MLVYTFRTYPHLDLLRDIFPDVFVFNNLKSDLEVFKQRLKNEQTDVLGIADTRRQSRVEPLAVNKFNKGTLDKNGPDQVELFVPPQLNSLKIADAPTTTFCNWTMYNIKQYIKNENMKSNISFVHINSEDIDKLRLLAG